MESSMPAAPHYDSAFYSAQRDGSLKSARAVVPAVIDLVKPQSVVDIGCGVGCWLRAFAERGIEDYVGLDGDYVNREELLIPRDRFRAEDLSRPASLDRTFDLAACLEVAEHLPAAAAAGLVKFLTSAAPVVLFSAAVPTQGGTNHVNEQWPAHWRELFRSHGYVRLDAIRPLIWRDPDVDWWYKQNLYLYVRQEVLTSRPRLAEEFARSRELPFELIHERVLQHLTHDRTLSELVRAFPAAIGRSLRRFQSRRETTRRG